MIYLFLLVGVIFGFIGSLMAFVITYHEYQKHQFERKRLIKEAFNAALYTFLFYIVIMAVVGLLISHHQF